MALTPEQMAEFLADEMMDDFERLYDSIVKLNDRWTKYGEPYQHLLSPEKRQKLEHFTEDFIGKMQTLADLE